MRLKVLGVAWSRRARNVVLRVTSRFIVSWTGSIVLRMSRLLVVSRARNIVLWTTSLLIASRSAGL